MAHLHLVLGPVGAGKSTFARTLTAELRALLLVLDDWMARLYQADERPASGRVAWYLERRDRCLAQLWEVADRVCVLGTPVVLEIGLIRRDERAAFYHRVDDAGHPHSVKRVGSSDMVEVEVANRGGRTASRRKIEGRLAGPGGKAETSDTVIDYLPPHSTRPISLLFLARPEHRRPEGARGQLQRSLSRYLGRRPGCG